MDGKELAGLIRQKLMDNPDESDPYVIAGYIHDVLTDKEAIDVARICLPLRVKETLRADRNNAMKKANRALFGPRPKLNGDEVAQKMRDTIALLKVAFEQRVFVKGEWKFLAQCSCEEVKWLAVESYRKASENNAKGDEYSEIARQMEEQGAQTVADLVTKSDKAPA
jgi:hypothetical protein